MMTSQAMGPRIRCFGDGTKLALTLLQVARTKVRHVARAKSTRNRSHTRDADCASAVSDRINHGHYFRLSDSSRTSQPETTQRSKCFECRRRPCGDSPRIPRHPDAQGKPDRGTGRRDLDDSELYHHKTDCRAGGSKRGSQRASCRVAVATQHRQVRPHVPQQPSDSNQSADTKR